MAVTVVQGSTWLAHLGRAIESSFVVAGVAYLAKTLAAADRDRCRAVVGYNADSGAATQPRDTYGQTTYPESRARAEAVMAAYGRPGLGVSCVG
ncbi:MAG TPA: hypothetical protein VGL23_18410 [Chloroflexota bacterium]